MTGFFKWGSLGVVVFEFLTSPQYGSITYDLNAKFTEYTRIISKGADGALAGQKPAKEVSGLDLDRFSFSCKVSATVLKKLSVSTLGSIALAAGAGPLVGSAIGDLEDDTRFYADVQGFIDTLKEVLVTQKEQAFSIGAAYQGLYTLDSLSIDPKHKADGTLVHAVIRLSLKEWVE